MPKSDTTLAVDAGVVMPELIASARFPKFSHRDARSDDPYSGRGVSSRSDSQVTILTMDAGGRGVETSSFSTVTFRK